MRLGGFGVHFRQFEHKQTMLQLGRDVLSGDTSRNRERARETAITTLGDKSAGRAPRLTADLGICVLVFAIEGSRDCKKMAVGVERRLSVT